MRDMQLHLFALVFLNVLPSFAWPGYTNFHVLKILTLGRARLLCVTLPLMEMQYLPALLYDLWNPSLDLYIISMPSKSMGKLIIHERHAATPVCSSISLSYQALHDLAIQTFTSYKYLHLGELKISSSLGTNNSASLPLMEESSLTSTLCTSRARTGAPRQDSAAMVNWISLLFNQWRTKLLWLPLERESSEDSMGISLKAFTAAATWNCKVEESWYLNSGSANASSFVWPLLDCWDKCHRHLLRFNAV